MKAIIYDKYGSPDNLKLEEVEQPIPAEGEVLIKVHAASLNASDMEFLTGSPAYVRAWGLFRPKHRILGSDIAGKVEAVGSKVQQFQPGDMVLGDILEHWGGFAQYVCALEKSLVLKPSTVSYETAATIPQAAVVALQGIRDFGQVEAGQKVLINGAGGGSGTFAIQLAKMLGGEVTGVDNAEKQEFMRAVGADHVIDYKRKNFTRSNSRYDFILDLVAHRSIFDYKRILEPHGKYAIVGGSMSTILGAVVLGPWISLTERLQGHKPGKKMRLLAVKANQKDLRYLVSLIEQGKLKPAIDKHFTLDDVPEAFRYMAKGHAKGKLVISMTES